MRQDTIQFAVDEIGEAVLREALRIGEAAAAILNFPAISIPGLKTVSVIYSKPEGKRHF